MHIYSFALYNFVQLRASRMQRSSRSDCTESNICERLVGPVRFCGMTENTQKARRRHCSRGCLIARSRSLHFHSPVWTVLKCLVKTIIDLLDQQPVFSSTCLESRAIVKRWGRRNPDTVVTSPSPAKTHSNATFNLRFLQHFKEKKQFI